MLVAGSLGGCGSGPQASFDLRVEPRHLRLPTALSTWRTPGSLNIANYSTRPACVQVLGLEDAACTEVEAVDEPFLLHGGARRAISVVQSVECLYYNRMDKAVLEVRAWSSEGWSPRCGSPDADNPAQESGLPVGVHVGGIVPRAFRDGMQPQEIEKYARLVEETLARGEPLGGLYRPVVTSPAFLSALGFGPEDRIADLGCGTGALEVALLEQRVPFGEIYAVDPSGPSLDFLSFQLESGGFEGSDRVRPLPIEPPALPIPPGTLDVVLVVNVNPLQARVDESSLQVSAELADSVASIGRAMKPGGRLLLFRETSAESYARPMEGIVRTQEIPAAARTHVRALTLPFTEQGFVIAGEELWLADSKALLHAELRPEGR